ncbi:MAG: sulfite exporter TauE/SafE family protein, partial [Caldimonas sp.]
LALLVSPAQVVPAIFILEVLASLTLLRGIGADIDWPWLRSLVLGNVLFIPLGILVLAWLPETQLRLAIGVLMLLAAGMQLRGRGLALQPTPRVRFVVGAISGFANGIAAIGGIAVAVLLSTTQLAPAALRATLIALFLVTDVYALAWAGLVSQGDASVELLGARTLAWAAWLTPAMLVGIAIGKRSFVAISPARFRRRVLELLVVVAMLGIARAAVDLAG